MRDGAGDGDSVSGIRQGDGTFSRLGDLGLSVVFDIVRGVCLRGLLSRNEVMEH